MNVFVKVGFGGAALLALAVTFAIGRSPPPPVVADAEPVRFDDTWIDATKTVELKNADVKNSIRQIELGKVTELSTLPKTVAAERVVPDAPAKMPPVIPLNDQPAAQRPRHAEARSEESNLCTRHKMHKVWVSKYKWRCRK